MCGTAIRSARRYSMPNHKPQSPRVLHVITPSRMAGAETFLVRLVRRTGDGGVVHRCASSRSAANAEMRVAGMTFDTLAISGKANLLAIPRLSHAVRRHKIDVLHSHLSTASWWCGWLERVGGPRSIGHVHGFTSAKWHRGQTHLIACSAAVKQDLLSKGFAAERITVMHYPVDPDDIRTTRSRLDLRTELGASPDTPIVGAFAHLSLKKGYRELVRAAEIVLRKMPAAQFWCSGEGALRGELEETARAMGIADKFKLLGFRRDVPDLMRDVDVMCLPSHREPFGLVYVEAALAEKAVVACNAGGAPEIIMHGETGLLVPPPTVDGPSNVTALAEAVLTLLDNRERAADMGRRGRELALQRFTWPRYLDGLNALYARVLDRELPSLRKAA